MIFSAGVILYVLGYVINSCLGTAFRFRDHVYMKNRANHVGAAFCFVGALLVVISVVILGLEMMP